MAFERIGLLCHEAVAVDLAENWGEKSPGGLGGRKEGSCLA